MILEIRVKQLIIIVLKMLHKHPRVLFEDQIESRHLTKPATTSRIKVCTPQKVQRKKFFCLQARLDFAPVVLIAFIFGLRNCQ